MKIHEYQAKQLLQKYGVKVPRGVVVRRPDEVEDAYLQLSATSGTVVIKAQIHAGGRGKAGGVRLVHGLDEARSVVAELLGRPLVTAQTGPEGRQVRALLFEEALPIARELYAGLVLDREQARVVLMTSAEGGVEIEQVAASSPEKILRASVDPLTGLMPYQVRRLAFAMGLDRQQVARAVEMFGGLARAFFSTDASLVEVNPLVVTSDGELVALDAKMNFDDNALYRHPEIAELRDVHEEHPAEIEASRHNLSYVHLDGNIGCMVNGAGLAMATMDLIKLCGGEPANFLDVGGGTDARRVAAAFKIILADSNVRAVLVNIFGGIVRCDLIAQGIIAAAGELEVKVPLVVRLQGTLAEEGRRLLDESGLAIKSAEGMEEAARLAVAAAGGAA